MDGDPKPPAPLMNDAARGSLVDTVLFPLLLAIALALYTAAYIDRLIMGPPCIYRIAQRAGSG
jgi:hypothetical protein